MKTLLTTLAASALIAGVSAQADVIDLQAIGATASTSNIFSGGYVAGNAIDQNTSSRWATNLFDSAWLLVDLKSSYDLGSLRIDWEAAHSRDYTIRVSDNALNPDTQLSSFTTVATITGRDDLDGSSSGLNGLGGGNADETFDFVAGSFTSTNGDESSSSVSTGVSGRYLLIHATARDQTWGHSIWEIELTAAPEPSSLALLALGGLMVARRRRD